MQHEKPQENRRISLYSKITFIIVLLSFLIRVIRLDDPHGWSFDEVYHALSAEAYALNDPRGYEWWNPSPKDLAYEWLHPPLGKLFMAASIKVFAKPYIPISKEAPVDGATSFAWRFPGTIFAALTVWLLIRFGNKLFNNYWIGAVAGFLYGLDGLSFVQSRTGMNDIYITFFVVLAFYRLFIFLKEYKETGTTQGKVVKNLIWLGIATGLAASTKWTGFYAVGICFVLGVTYILKNKDWKMFFVSALLLSLLPVLVYITSYSQWWIQGHTWKQFYELHQQIWWYQTGLKATHGYQSQALTWPFLYRPVWFYVKYEDRMIDGEKILHIGNIYTMGHPFIWWAGLLAIGYMTWRSVRTYALIPLLWLSGANKDMIRTLTGIPKNMMDSSSTHRRNDKGGSGGKISRYGTVGYLPFMIILVGYFGMFVPWALSPRIMFLYHYLPSVPFLCLGLAYALWVLRESGKIGKTIVTIYILLVILGFIYFYPHWSGYLLPQKWVDYYYWLPSWK